MSEQQTHLLLGNLGARLSSIESVLKASNLKSDASRAAVYDALREIREDAADTRHRVQNLERAMKDDVQPVIRGVRDWRSRALGAIFVLGAVGSGVILFVTSARDIAVAIWQAWTER